MKPSYRLSDTPIRNVDATSQVPRRAQADIDMRYTEAWSLTTLEELVLHTVKDCEVGVCAPGDAISHTERRANIAIIHCAHS